MLITKNPAQNNGKLKFLIVEDDISSQQSMKLALTTKFNCDIYLAASGEEAIEIVNNEVFDIIFMNIGLADMDGLDAAKIIRQREREGSKICSIIIATSGMPEIKQKCLDAGMDDFLAKPYNCLELEKMVEKFIPVK